MTILEKVAYIKGMAAGMELNADSNEVKLINAIIDTLDEIAAEIEDIEDAQVELVEQIDAVDEDLSAVEDIIYDDDECDGDCDGCDGCDCDDDEVYEVTCPKCNDTIYIDEMMLEDGGIKCPNCGTDLEFDFSDDEENSTEE